MSGYNEGEVKEYQDKMSCLSSQGESNVEGDCSMKGIKEENSMNGYLQANNPAYKG